MQEQLASLGQGLEAVAADQSIPEEAKAAFQASLEAFKAGMEAIAGGAPPAPGGTVTPEQGASGAVPMSHGRMR